MKSAWLLLLTVSLFHFGSSYKILVMDPTAARSHYNIGKAVADILQEKGHEVTMVGAYAASNPKYREIVVPEMVTEGRKLMNLGFQKGNMTMTEMMKAFMYTFPQLQDIYFNSPTVKEFHSKKEQFDLVIVEYFLNEMLLGYGVKYNCPIILLSPVGMMNFEATLTENPLSLASVPDIFLPFASPMSFLERTINSFAVTGLQLMHRFVLLPGQEEMYKKHFTEEAKKVPFSELMKKISLIFLNSHSSLTHPRPLLPNAVEIAGYHVDKSASLTKEFEDIIKNSKHGVIFFSMGSNLKSAEMAPETKNAFLKVFSGLKETVIWKFEEDLKNKPKNVIIKNWLPQTAILGHPKVKLFITHGGFLSLVEAVDAGKPLLSIPIFGDQYHNANNVQRKEIGLTINVDNITETSLGWALNELLNNTKYALNMKALRKTFLDRPVGPRDLVAFYVEHVIKTGGAAHLTSTKLSLCQHLLLDVMGLFVFLPMSVFIALTWMCCKACRRSKQSKPVKESKKLKKN